MNKLTANNRGFTIVEGLLLVLVVAVIAFGGYYVYSNQKHKTTNSSTPTTTSSTSTPKATPIKSTDPYDGWKTATLQYEKISYKYPSDWTLTDSSFAMPKSQGGCTYPGADRVALVSPSGEEVNFETGMDCIGDAGTVPFGSDPLTAFDQSVFLVVQGHPYDDGNSPVPAYACLAPTATPTSFIAFTSKNIFADTASAPKNSFCYYPYNKDALATSGTIPPTQTADSIKNSKDYATAKLIFGSMKY
jgi:hypothetical protein